MIWDSLNSDYPDYCHLERDVSEEPAASMFKVQAKRRTADVSEN